MQSGLPKKACCSLVTKRRSDELATSEIGCIADMAGLAAASRRWRLTLNGSQPASWHLRPRPIAPSRMMVGPDKMTLKTGGAYGTGFQRRAEKGESPQGEPGKGPQDSQRQSQARSGLQARAIASTATSTPGMSAPKRTIARAGFVLGKNSAYASFISL